MNLMVYLLLIVLTELSSIQQSPQKYAGHALLVPMHTYIPIFNEKEKLSVINYIINDTIKEEYVLIAIHRIKDSMADVTVSSPLDSTFTDIRGWIETQYLGIHVSCYDSDIVQVLKTPNPDSDVSFVIHRPQWRDFYIVYNAYQNWLFIQNINNKHEYGWLSPKYQCDNPYTSCN